MAGTITKLEVQKRNKERVNVYLDGEFALGVSLSAALELKKGQVLSDAELAALKQADDRRKAYDRAIFYLGFRARSRAEMERYLRDKEFTPEVINETVARLEREGYLDDAVFADAWVESRQRSKPKSRRALKYELRQKGLKLADIENALDDIDEETAARDALAKKLWQWQSLAEDTFKKKALGFLSRRGFSYEIVRNAVDEAWESLANADG